MNRITPFLWFDNNAEEAVKFYTKTFKNSKINKTSKYDVESAKVSGQKIGTVMTIDFTLEGQTFAAINGGPIFKFTPAVSFTVNCKDVKEIDTLYAKLSKDGKIMMPLDKYPFSQRFAFISDRFGLSWQLTLSESAQKIVPGLLFVGNKLKKAEDAIHFYTKVFKKSTIINIMKYGAGEPGIKGTIKYSLFSLEDQYFSIMAGTGPHKFDFNESISFVVNCKDQKEIDYYWKQLTSDGGQEVQCGWLRDKFGVSWQVVPTSLVDKMLNSKNPKKLQNMLKVMYTMKKFDIVKLQKAYDGK